LGAASGADTDLSTDRGNLTHSHTSPSHTPIQNAHNHTIAAENGASSGLTAGGAGIGPDLGHGHNPSTSTSTTAVNNGIAITVNTTSNDLAFLEVIWIKSDGSPTTLPSGSIAFFASDSLPASWSRVNGNGYLKGAAAAGNGGATGGANTHTHTSPAHTHTQNTHTHTATSGTLDISAGKGTGAQVISSNGHTHAVLLSSQNATNQPVTTTLTASNHEPPFSKINVIQSALASLPNNIITLWLGSNAGIPAGWTRYTALDSVWAKGCNANGEGGTTGGTSQHTHTASDCLPIQDLHAHVIVDPGATGTITSNPAGLNNLAQDGHTHIWDDNGQTATNQTTSVTIDLSTAGASFPKHRTVIYVTLSSGPPPPPGPSITGITTYDAISLNIENLFTGKDPAAAQRIWRGDHRFSREE
jgi:hypothetical protein